jgi:hypothetical protein
VTQRERSRRARERRLLVVRLRRQGWTWARIGKEIGCSGPRAFKLHKLGDELAKRRADAGLL